MRERGTEIEIDREREQVGVCFREKEEEREGWEGGREGGREGEGGSSLVNVKFLSVGHFAKEIEILTISSLGIVVILYGVCVCVCV